MSTAKAPAAPSGRICEKSAIFVSNIKIPTKIFKRDYFPGIVSFPNIGRKRHSLIKYHSDLNQT